MILRIIHRQNEDKVDNAAESDVSEDNSKDEHVNNQSSGKSFWSSGSLSMCHCSSSSIVSLLLLATSLLLIF